MPPGTPERWRFFQRTLVGRLKQDESAETDFIYRVGGGNGWDLLAFTALIAVVLGVVGWVRDFRPVLFFLLAAISGLLFVVLHWPRNRKVKLEDDLLEDWISRVQARLNHG